MLAGKKVKSVKSLTDNQLTVAEMSSMGGKARAKKLTAEQRQGIAQKAARARWGKRRKNR